MKIDLTDSLIESVLPNVVVTVEGEEALASRVAAYADDACRWLESNLLGPLNPDPEHAAIASRAVAMRALVMAIPALDLVVTPTGFGVISSSNLAPASKERVERLTDKLSEALDELLCQLQDACLGYESWRASAQGRRFCSTFLFKLRDTFRFPGMKGDIFARYDEISSLAASFEMVLAEKYIGMEIIGALRTGMFALNPLYDEVISRIRHADVHLVSRRRESPRCPDDHEVWHDARHIIHALREVPELMDMYERFRDSRKLESMTQSPKRRGGFFF